MTKRTKVNIEMQSRDETRSLIGNRRKFKMINLFRFEYDYESDDMSPE